MTFGARVLGYFSSSASGPTSIYDGGDVIALGLGSGCSAQVTFNANGTITHTATNDGSSAPPTTWYTPTTTGVGSSYWIRATLSSGSALTSGTLNAWTSLASNQTWTLTAAGGGLKSSFVLIEISSSSGGSPVVASGTVFLEADGT